MAATVMPMEGSPGAGVDAGGGRARGAPASVCRREDAPLADPELFLPPGDVPPDPVMELRRAHLALELLLLEHPAEEGVGVEENLVGEQDVVDPDDPFLVEDRVVEERGSRMHLHPEPEVNVVVEVRPRRYDPVDEPGPDQRGHAGNPHPRGPTSPRK